MIKLNINDYIGFDEITNAKIVEQLKNIAPAEEIEIEINSLGGSVYECIAIFNTIRQYAKTNPVSVFMNGIVASAASVIAIAARTVYPQATVKVCENSIYFIHNPINVAWGDYKALLKEADYLERLAIMFGGLYSGVTTKTVELMRRAMDEETYYIGNEIVEAGFANNFEQINPNTNITPENRAAMIANAQMMLVDAKKRISENQKKDEVEKAVAMLQMSIGNVPPFKNGESFSAKTNSQKPQAETQGGQKVVKMTPQELQEQQPECYKAVFELGQKAERERVVAHLTLAEESKAWDTASKYIKDGASTTSESVSAEYVKLAITEAKKTATMNKDRMLDNPPPNNVSDDSDDTALMAAFEGGYYGRTLKGNKHGNK